MLEELRTFIARVPRSSSISTPRISSYINNIEQGVKRLIERNDRFVTDPIPSNGIDYLNSLIVRADIPYLLRFKNDMERLGKIMHEYRSPVYSDFIRQYPIREKCFIQNKIGKTLEFLLITDDFNIIQNLPIGSNNFDEWLDVRPVRMLSNDSSEIQLDITTSRLRYNNYAPKEVVMSINIVKLLMVYTKYRILYPERFLDNTNNYPFIYQACLLPLLYDNVRNWLTKIIYDIIILKSIDPEISYVQDTLVHGEKSSFVIGSRQSALLEIEDLISKCAKGALKPDEVLVSLDVWKNVNLYTEINWLIDSHYVGNRGVQFRWAEFEREYFVLAIMIGLYGLQPDSNRTLELKKLFNIVTRRYENTKFWSAVGNPFLADHIRMKFGVMKNLLV